ncbi:MAG: malate synthase G [Gammaproteobacteria bacterium]|nr:malate synthase G [Gammaproteobacteria bacterium]
MSSGLLTTATSHVAIAGTDLEVSVPLHNLVVNEILPDLGMDAAHFWSLLEEVITEMAPKNNILLLKRYQIQAQINTWHQSRSDKPHDHEQYRKFLQRIGYLLPEGPDFTVTTTNVDDEIAHIAGPQLVVPVKNARYALNATNARWGSLYDALYGTDAIDEADGAEKGTSYNPRRGAKVIAWARAFLDEIAPLAAGSHTDAVDYSVVEAQLAVKLGDGTQTGLADATRFAGYNGRADAPSEILLRNNNLHVIIQIDPSHPVGKDDAAHIKDIVLESAVTTIQDCEDSVAAADGEDKAEVYRNWLGLMRGNLTDTFRKGGHMMTRTLNPDLHFLDPKGRPITLHGRSLLLVRNVGHLMTNEAVLLKGQEAPEGILDAVITATIALYDIKGLNQLRNSRKGSMYIVKPKMHGPEEVAFACELFAKVEDVLKLPRHTLKIGIMDEERRTTINLKECIRAAKDRIIFINTGFLDRTGDEIHTSMEAGVMARKEAMRHEPWIKAYENWNVDIGLACGLQGVAQIGKGMWPKPDLMKEMLESKQAHLEAGANTAWVPSPTAATLHATHYHKVLVSDVQDRLKHRKRASLDDILTIPLLGEQRLTADEIQQELDNNCQGILGYVVRWVELGIGCSKVPDINDVGLMEDRATLRISSQHVANWLRHDFVRRTHVLETLKRMAEVVDRQNAGDPDYKPMSANFDESIAFQAACELVFGGVHHPNGYTEPVLHRRRLEMKQSEH